MILEDEYRIDIKVRNNLILTKIESLGYKSAYEFCNAAGLSYPSLLKFINMKNPIFDSKGRVKPSIQKLCDLLKCIPEEIFSASQMEASLKSNKRTLQVKEAEMIFLMNQSSDQNLLEDLTEREQFEDITEKALASLTQKEEKVLQMRFGLGSYTKEYNLSEIAEEFGVTRTRIAQIEATALRKLRHPSRLKELRHFLHPDEVLSVKEQEIKKLLKRKEDVLTQLRYVNSFEKSKIFMMQQELKKIDIEISKLEGKNK